MTGDIPTLAARLEELSRAPGPPMRLNITAAREVGRRRLRRRRFTVAGASAAVALALGLAVPSIGPFFTGPPMTMSTVALSTGPDLLVAHASFGWLPSGVDGVGYQAGAHSKQMLARGAGDLGTRIILSLYASSAEPVLKSFADGGDEIAVPAPPVDGRPAYWITHDADDPLNGGDTYLRWRTAQGPWAELHAYYLNVDDPQDVLLRVAAGVTIGDRAVPLPLRLSGLPSGFRVDEVQFWRPPLRGTGAWELQMFASVGGSRVTFAVGPPGSAPKLPKSKCEKAEGLTLCVLVEGGTSASLDAIGGPLGLLDRVTLLGRDERAWTTRVVE
ncbi:hypothetical protein [Microbispora sp. NPDC049125]|uniref:hypothetical protein n=1 Tax=Microbispora sp. NPDC049125 TaxID=3154929 RepID=UPI00346583B1